MRHGFTAAALAALLGACAGHRPPAPPPPLPDPELTAFLDAEADLARALREADRLGTLPDAVLPFGISHSDFDLPIVVNDRVEFWIDYFSERHHEWFATYLRRMGRYEEFIRGRLRERGMPEDLIWLALIESGFTPRAYSRAHAAGIWQFIPGTARRYGLEVGQFVDERRDPVASTDAALAYLSDLHRMFGSWYLAAAAYNSGENRVAAALEAHAGGARGSDTLFWTIAHALPSETRNYVPKLLAAAIVGKYGERFGFGDVAPDTAERFDVLHVPDATDLGVVGELISVADEEMRALNPHFVRGVTPPRRNVEVRVPAGLGPDAYARYADLPPERRIRFLEHRVERGETLWVIARQYRTSVSLLQEANGIRDAGSIRAGRVLVIPTSGIAPAAARNTAARSRTAEVIAGGGAEYRVRRGDTLWSIARRHGVTVDQIRAWNGLAEDRILPGQTLRVREAAER